MLTRRAGCSASDRRPGTLLTRHRPRPSSPPAVHHHINAIHRDTMSSQQHSPSPLCTSPLSPSHRLTPMPPLTTCIHHKPLLIVHPRPSLTLSTPPPLSLSPHNRPHHPPCHHHDVSRPTPLTPFLQKPVSSDTVSSSRYAFPLTNAISLIEPIPLLILRSTHILPLIARIISCRPSCPSLHSPLIGVRQPMERKVGIRRAGRGNA